MTQPDTGPAPAAPAASDPDALQVVAPGTFEDLRVDEVFRAPGRTLTDAHAHPPQPTRRTRAVGAASAIPASGMTPRLLLPGLLIGCAVLTGCTSQSTDGAAGVSPSGAASTGGPTATGTAGDGTSGPSPTTSSGGAGTASSEPAVPATGRRCHTSELRASVGADHPGAGQSNFALVLTNASHRTCTVRGFPGVAFVNRVGEAVTPDPERATGEAQQTVTLAPGAAAWSAMTYTNPAVTGVTTVTPAVLRITPPDETAWIPVSWTGGEVSDTGKASVPRLSPLRAGDGS
ncbi:lipoprotein [Streptomyces hygroscopicus subsp. hygroscopicus]|uniref:DUF4232 domain-containing protein n=1 Tax=Streptomyces sp. KHY 26 TaxID=3097359 RepID=UPI0024A5C77C|nr:DUF4232 domain-containing protein [Streptomyces hygroscopicus]GLX54581.1 lipoprotein [Streptomyces hygroscopicus subsp. hygroscopicus]